MIEIERVNNIGERRMHIHGAAGDQRRPLVTAQDAGRKSPYGDECSDVSGINLFERRITRICIITSWLRPIFACAGDSLDSGGGHIVIWAWNDETAHTKNKYDQQTYRGGEGDRGAELLPTLYHPLQAILKVIGEMYASRTASASLRPRSEERHHCTPERYFHRRLASFYKQHLRRRE